MKSSKQKSLIFTTFEYGFAIFAFSLFAYNSYLTLTDYLEEKAGLNQYLTTESNLALPAITVCPKNLYKEADENATVMLKNISRYVYDLDDIFGSLFMLLKDDWIIKEVFGTNMGKCYTLHRKEPINEYSQVWIDFKPNNTYKLFFHEAGNEYWRQASLNAVPSAEITFGTFAHNRANVAYSRILLKKFHHIKISRTQYACQNDATLETYTKCAFDELITRRNGNCLSLLTFGEPLENSSLCQDFDKFSEAVQNDNRILKFIKGNATCLMPCQTSTFDAKLINYHQNAALLLPRRFSQASNDTSIGFIYDQFTIEHQNEYLVVDGSILISGIGGFLGLFLGYSMLSITGNLIDLLRKLCKA